MRRGAVFDRTGAYRYLLWRSWDGSGPAVSFIMLNPSTADSGRDDPTIRRCLGFARDWGFGRLLVTNLFAFRTPYPAVLRSVDDPVGPANDGWIRRAVASSSLVIAAWGTHGAAHGRDRAVLDLLGTEPCCLGLTASGFPRHPLYLRRETRPVRLS